MTLIKPCSVVVVMLAAALSGCAAKQPYEKLPKLDETNYEAYTYLIVKKSVENCHERVRSVTQELEACTYQLTNKYFEKLYQAGKIEHRIVVSP